MFSKQNWHLILNPRSPSHLTSFFFLTSWSWSGLWETSMGWKSMWLVSNLSSDRKVLWNMARWEEQVGMIFGSLILKKLVSFYAAAFSVPKLVVKTTWVSRLHDQISSICMIQHLEGSGIRVLGIVCWSFRPILYPFLLFFSGLDKSLGDPK